MADGVTTIRFSNPNYANLGLHIQSCALRNLPMVERNSMADSPGVVIAGSGRSLTTPQTLAAIRRRLRRGWHLIACKESIRLLRGRGIRVDFSVSMDPGDNQWRKTWKDPAIVYCVASSCHPALFDYLLADGHDVRVFHSACGSSSEAPLYATLFPCGDVVQGGYTVVNRALGLAVYMGFGRRVLAGADMGWRPSRREIETLHAKGDIGEALYRAELARCDDRDGTYAAGAVERAATEGSEMHDRAAVDGRLWMTRPDMLCSAVALARHLKRGKIAAVLGDSMVKSLARRDEDFLRRVLPPPGGIAAARVDDPLADQLADPRGEAA